MSNPVSLKGKFALVTGSGRENGIGASIARKFAENGAAVAIHYVSPSSKPRAEKVAADLHKEFNVPTTVVQGVVGEPGTADKIVQSALDGLKTDHLDILVNNAGFGEPSQLLEIGHDAVDKIFKVNTYGVLYLSQAVARVGKMPQGGRIINIGSVASKLASPETGVYAAAKAAADALTLALAGALGKSHGITVNTLAPGPVRTDLAKDFLSNETFVQSILAITRGGNRVGTTDDIASAALLIASEGSRWITGQFISVSGGIV